MGSVGGEEEFPAGLTGADAEVGALVWVRRRNGSWWPGRILSQAELPENCVIPPRSAGTPIKLLGRADGSIDWYNLEKSKRVKAFRCGEYEECIEKAKALASQQKRAYTEGKYVRREDAIMHALEIEKSRFPNKYEMNDAVGASHNSYFAKSKSINEGSKRSSRITRDLYGSGENSSQGFSQALTLWKVPQNISSSSTRYASSSRKKRKASNKFKDDTVQGFRRMRDLGDIGSKKSPKQKPSTGVFSNGHQYLPLLESGTSFGYDFPGTNGVNKSKESHSVTKRKRSNIGQAYENARKKDRRRPISKLCNDESAVTVPTYSHWDSLGQSSVHPEHNLSNVFERSRGRSSFSMDANSYSSGTSSVETLVDSSCKNGKGPAEASQIKEFGVSGRTGLLNDDCSDDDELFDAPLAMRDDVLEEGHLHKHGSTLSVKYQIPKPEEQTTDYIKGHISSPPDHTSSDRTSIRHERTIKCQAHKDVIGLDARVGSSSFLQHTDLEHNMQQAIVPADGCAGVTGQQYYGSGPEHDESSETISNHSVSEKAAASSPYHESTLQVILPGEKHDLRSARCHVVKPIRSGRAAYKLYDVELIVEGSYKSHRAPLVSLMSKWNGKPIVGFPVPVEVLDDSCPVTSRDDHSPVANSLNQSLKRGEVAEPRQARTSHASRSKPSGRKKISEHDVDKSWRPHTKKSASSPKKMRRLSSFGGNRRESANRKPVIGKIGGPTIACIPLRLVFSRINEALSFPVRSENPT